MIYRDMWQAGFRVFPLLGAHDDDGEPLNDKEAFKRPRSSGWKSTPDWSSEQMDLMEQTGQFATGYGVLCAGLIVVDVDARNGGVASYNALLEQIPELDDAGLIVATGSGGGSKHLYFKAPHGVALVQHIKGFDGIDMKASGFVVGPGSMHRSGATYAIIEGHPDNIEDAPAALIDLLRKPEYHRTEYNGGVMDVTEADIADMLGCIDGTDMEYEEWVRIGMAIHDALGGCGYELWDDWSSKSPKYDSSLMEKRWHSFGKASMPVTIGTLVHYAEQGGWQQPVTFEADYGSFDTSAAHVSLLDTSSVDLLRPPGFVGEVCLWINDQCMYPREHLAVMAAIVAVGNVIGLRYKDDISGVTANLFGFGVADSGTGKDSVYGAFGEIMRAAGIVSAMHGAQKSEQELIRNLIRHQASFYNIDEFGIQLKKVINATKSGASYLEGLIGMMMNAYSKADSFLPVGGDVKEELKDAIRREISQHQKAIDNNEDPTGKRQSALDQAARMLQQVNSGIERPFLSVMGMTTPVTFDELVTPEQASSGFIGRAIIVRELDPNPEAKYPFKKRPMPDNMAMHLQALYSGGEYDAECDRVENYNPRIAISTEPDAVDAMRQVYEEFWEMAETQKEHTGLTAIPRRGYELVSKVSLVLAAPSGVRTIEHIRWAYALVKRDVDEKLRLVMSNDASYGTDRVLMSKITNVISDDHGETIGVIKNKLRKYKGEDVVKALRLLEARGLARNVITKAKTNGKTAERWFFTG